MTAIRFDIVAHKYPKAFDKLGRFLHPEGCKPGWHNDDEPTMQDLYNFFNSNGMGFTPSFADDLFRQLEETL